MPNMMSPNDLQAGAIKIMLEGKEPVTQEDWIKCVNFWAANILPDFAHITCNLMGKIFSCPVSEKDIEEIVEFQLKAKKKGTKHAKNKR